MRQDFGSEFRNLADVADGVTIPTDPLASDVSVGRFFDQIRDQAIALRRSVLPVLPPQGIIFYIPPGRFVLRRNVRKSDVKPDPDRPTVYELPENVQLYVCQGALIRPEEGVHLVIRGSVRAGPYQIFGYDRFVRRPPNQDRVGLNTVPLGRVVFATRKVPALYPEWWGAMPVSDGILQTVTDPVAMRLNLRRNDSSDALQAAIDAACVTHEEYHDEGPDGPRPYPTIPVLLAGAYNSFHTLKVDAPGGDRSRLLILRGYAAPGNGGTKQSTINSIPIPPDAYEGQEQRPEEPAERCLLRLDRKVHFELEDLYLLMEDSPLRAAGCVDIRCDTGETLRRGLIRRCLISGGVRYALRVTAPDDTDLRHLVMDASVVNPGTESLLSDRGIDFAAGLSSMIHVDSCNLGHNPTPFDPRNPALPHANAVIHVQGGSMLVRSSMFHNATGPRPSRGNTQNVGLLGLTEPDGQEVFLAPARGRGSNHFTGVHMECQGWWFLSRASSGGDHVVLINLSHHNIPRNWNDLAERGDNAGRYRMITNLGVDLTPLEQLAAKGAPPSVVWLGAGGRCVLIGCRLDDYLLTDGLAIGQIVDVGTTFFRDRPGPPKNIRLAGAPGSVVAPPLYDGTILPGWSGDADLPHLVPYSIL